MFDLLATTVSLSLLLQDAGSAWRPADDALLTRWAAEVAPDNAHRTYPRPQLVREHWMSLNGLWEFAPGDVDDEAPIGQALTRRILVPFPVQSALSGIGEHHDRLWYRRAFEIPSTWNDQRILLHFDAVDWEARVWINGALLGTHRGGYDRFTLDITDALTGAGPHELIVGVWDPTDLGTQPRGKQVSEPRGIWYTPTSGIWQSVWLEPVGERSIESLGITPRLAQGTVRLASIARHDTEPFMTVRVLADDATVALARGPSPLVLSIDDPRPWSPDDPFLYDLEVELIDPQSGAVLDSVKSYFGMRSVDVAPDHAGVPRLRLNGEVVFHIGMLDQGFWPDGLYTAPTDEALRYDIEVTKALGFNTIRKHVKIEPDRWYYWCDRLGVLVWQDMPSGDASPPRGEQEIHRTEDSADQFDLELQRLIEQHGNHPSVIMWVPFNEAWGQFDTQRITDLVRKLDPTRIVNAVSGWHDLGTGDVHDVHAYPGPAMPEVESARAAVLGEFGGLGLPIEDHTWSEESWGYRGVGSKDELTDRYIQLMRGVWSLRRKGLAAAIYTQITDVETECNGLLTYDRAVIKVDVEAIASANRGRLPQRVPVVRCALDDGLAPAWRYTISAPPDDWMNESFDDSAWALGAGGFGRDDTPGAIIGTPWLSEDIWIRRLFELDAADITDELRLLIHHDEDAKVHINGILAAELTGYTTAYEERRISEAARGALRPGENVLAIHCRQTTGGQFIDAGLIRLVAASDHEPPSSR